MKSAEIRQKYLHFFEKRGHTIIPSASLVPENDPTTLFTGSGMQPLVPYLLGQKHPQGTLLVNSQKCFRSGDIDDVGDNRHTTFFEMLGNWSLGAYFKKEQLTYFFTFLTEEVGLDPKKIYVTVFAGDPALNIPKDEEAIEIWKELFASKGIIAETAELITEEGGSKIGMKGEERIFLYREKNWWSRAGAPSKMPSGEPGGPDSEVFYEFDHIDHNQAFGEKCHPNCDCGRFLEIGNSVFMEYKKEEDGSFSKLPQKNVDFGGGFERIVAVSDDKSDIFKIDIFEHLIGELQKSSGKSYDDDLHTKSFRIVADHLRSATFLIGDGVLPANSDQGYFVRRLIRRAVIHTDKLNSSKPLADFVEPLLEYYKDAYPKTRAKAKEIALEIQNEEAKFRETLVHGLKEFKKITAPEISGYDAFLLFSTFGFPLELTQELAKEQGKSIDEASFNEEMKKHQDLSRAGSLQKFKGGLAGHSEKELQYHTATHLLNAALRKVLGDHVSQKGSNITPERLRFDFNHSTKMTPEEIAQTEDWVNEQIKRHLPVSFKEIPKEDAQALGAIGVFDDKYGDIVKVYQVGNNETGIVSMELCGGPHVTNTKELGHFKILKEEAVSAGVRRIKAILE